jgi:hypothetical protein
MPISLVAKGTDSNGAVDSTFVGIPLPVGVANGDLMLVAIALPAAGVTVTPPSSDWTQIAATDPATPLIMSVWWTVALTPPVSLVFTLSASVRATGAVLVYRGAHILGPIDAIAAQLTAASVTHNVPGISIAQGGEEVVLFMGGASSSTWTPAGGFQEVVAKQQTGCSISAQRRPALADGPAAGFTETFGASARGAAVIIAIAPSPGLTSFDDAYQRVFDALPPGIDNVLDFTVGSGDFYKLTWVVGALLKLFVFDAIDLLRAESVAYLSRFKLPDWEGDLGLRGSRVAQIGTIVQRQAQVLGAWRSAAGQGSSIPTVQGVMRPLLGYNPSTPVRVIEADISGIQALHRYSFPNDLTIAPSSSGSVSFNVTDGGKVAAMGAQLELISDTSSLPFAFTLKSPDGRTAFWQFGNWPTNPVKLFAKNFAGAQIQGLWTLTVQNNGGAPATIYAGSTLFVEGIARGQQTGGAVFDWGVYADPAHVGENGAAVDFIAVRAALHKLNFSHAIANVIQSLSPWPDTDSGLHAAIPDECLPT